MAFKSWVDVKPYGLTVPEQQLMPTHKRFEACSVCRASFSKKMCPSRSSSTVAARINLRGLCRCLESSNRAANSMDAQTRRSLLCRHCNFERAQRVTQGYRPSARLKQAFAILSRPQFWMVLRRTGALILRIVCPCLWQRHVSIRTFACASYAAMSIGTLWIAPLRVWSILQCLYCPGNGAAFG